MDTGERRLVATMPLHAITSTYGEEGLRARFAVEVERWPGPDQRRLNQALALAGRLHAADSRDREPYVNHLLRVAIRVMSHYGVHDADVVCAALLHDAVEGDAAELARRAPGKLRSRRWQEEFGPGVAGLVAAVTNPESRRSVRLDEQYREHVSAACGLTVGTAHQGLRLHRQRRGPDPHHRPRLRRLSAKYAPLVPVLQELIALPDTPLGDPARQRILTQLGQAADRFAAILR